MGEMIEITCGDRHRLSAWRSEPEGQPKAGLIVLQEIFGITDHIRRVTDDYARRGYLAIAPSMFDRIEPGVVLDYTEVERGRSIMSQLKLDQCVLDMQAAIDAARPAGKVGAVGYCWGGAMADLAACSAGADAASSYYGRMIVEWLDKIPAAPVIYHFGETDPLIPREMIEQIRGARPDGTFHVYPAAGHGFNCDERADYNPDAAALALTRTLQFFDQYL